MDIFAHGLWSNLAGGYYNLKNEKKEKINKFWAVFWGIFPDLFAFSPIFIWSILNKYNIKPENFEPSNPDTLFINNLTHFLYNISHSLIVFVFILGIIFFIKKKIYLTFLGWPFHILIDIPTHSYRFYPTPFLWPISDFKINGFSWAEPWFMILNYVSILILYIIVFWKFNKYRK